MRRDYLKLRLSDPSPGSISSSFHASDSEEENERLNRNKEDGLPQAVLSAQACIEGLRSRSLSLKRKIVGRPQHNSKCQVIVIAILRRTKTSLQNRELNTSVNNATANLQIEKLASRENYSTWKFAVKSYLEIDDIWECIDPGTEVDPKKDVKAKSKIILLVEPVNYVHLENATSSKKFGKTFKMRLKAPGCLEKLAY
ncbi:hypothetical protein EVAR_94134_1 [Eumeta japonica]|uniref:Uncharacterized protein n=1 Tax=Eumeta variegata TaxID=151549 RepID=A0A4C1U6U7_EUMVA|nr:hypothetical protein EVAR_94134_1 [Eumeta japonica]